MTSAALTATAGTIASATPSLAASKDELSSLTKNAAPITKAEREWRVERARELMKEQKISALIMEAGSTLTYFTGLRWWRSERFTGAILPADGEIAYITPYFEEPSVRQSIQLGDDVRTWHENENPFLKVAGVLEDRGIKSGRIAIEETTRFFVLDGIRQTAPDFDYISGNTISRGCRMFKTAAELELMQLANDVTIAAYRHVHPQIEAGMTPADISAMMNKATIALGGRPQFAMALVGEASAYPHGSDKPQVIEDGAIVLMDCGCTVEDYQSDISRTFVFGDPSAKQREVWETVKQGQELALETAKIGTPAGVVDDTVRRFYESKGYGPGYKTPGLSHRLGHGIGIDGHEQVNFVGGEETLLQPGMCFSNEPGIYVFGEFGVRLEDCLYMTEDGPKLFTSLSPSIDKPFG